MTETATTQDVVYALAASPDFARQGICFAGRDSGLYHSTDRGKTWRFAYQSLNPARPLPTMAVAVSPDFAGDQTVFAGVPGGILRSFDGGNSWHISRLPDPPPTVTGLVFSPNYRSDGTVFAGTLEDGVFFSSDRGESWVTWNFGLYDPHVLCMAISPNFAADQTLYIGVEIGIFCSTNKGRTWREVALPANDPVLSLAISPTYAGNGILLAGTENRGLYLTEDGGKSWVYIAHDAITGAVNAIILSPEFPDRPEILLLLDDAILVSPDGGKSWFQGTTGPNFEQGTSCIVAPQGLAAAAPLLVGLVEGGVVITERRPIPAKTPA